MSIGSVLLAIGVQKREAEQFSKEQTLVGQAGRPGGREPGKREAGALRSVARAVGGDCGQVVGCHSPFRPLQLAMLGSCSEFSRKGLLASSWYLDNCPHHLSHLDTSSFHSSNAPAGPGHQGDGRTRRNIRPIQSSSRTCPVIPSGQKIRPLRRNCIQ